MSRWRTEAVNSRYEGVVKTLRVIFVDPNSRVDDLAFTLTKEERDT